MQSLHKDQIIKMKNVIKRFVKKYFYYLLLTFMFLIGLIVGFIFSPVALADNEKDIFVTSSDITDFEEKQDWIEFTATAYCSCNKCCGKNDGITASGKKAKQGITIASDWELLPCGTLVEIDGLGVYQVQDKGSSIKGNKVDIYFDNHQDALEFGVKTVRLRIVGYKM